MQSCANLDAKGDDACSVNDRQFDRADSSISCNVPSAEQQNSITAAEIQKELGLLSNMAMEKLSYINDHVNQFVSKHQTFKQVGEYIVQGVAMATLVGALCAASGSTAILTMAASMTVKQEVYGAIIDKASEYIIQAAAA